MPRYRQRGAAPTADYTADRCAKRAPTASWNVCSRRVQHAKQTKPTLNPSSPATSMHPRHSVFSGICAPTRTAASVLLIPATDPTADSLNFTFYIDLCVNFQRTASYHILRRHCGVSSDVYKMSLTYDETRGAGIIYFWVHCHPRVLAWIFGCAI